MEKPARLFFLFLSISITALYSDVPRVISYQGKLIDGSGLPQETPVDITFSLWDAPIGGNKLWEQVVLSVDPAHGIFSVELDLTTGWESGYHLDNLDGTSHYLQLMVDSDELSPRDHLSSSVYALIVADTSITESKIRWATEGTAPASGQVSAVSVPIEDAGGYFTTDNVEAALQEIGAGGTGGSDNDWQVVGNDMYSIPSGNVGIGTTSPGSKLVVRNQNATSKIRITTDDGSFAAGTGDVYVQYDLAGGGMGPGAYIWTTGIDNSDGQRFKISGAPDNAYPGFNDHLTIQGNGNVGIGTTSPTARLEISGQLKITGGSPGAGKVMTSDANGLGTWETPSGGGANQLSELSDVGSATVTSGNLLIADGTDWESVTMSGDATIDASGILSISENAIDGSNIAIGGDTQGDILYYNGTTWVRLPAGSDGNVLTTHGSGANPSWATGGSSAEYTQKWEFISTTTSGSWANTSLGSFGVPPNTVCEVNIRPSVSGNYGVRETGSTENRIISDDGSITMNVKTNGSSEIEYYRGNTADFYLAGYWNTPACTNPTAYAGTDGSTCGSTPYALDGTATNEESILWMTSGTGSFDNATIENPVYTPSAGDVIAGSVNLTMTAYALPPCVDASDDMTLTITSNLSNVAIAPTDAQSICPDGTGTEITCTPTGGGTPSYQWGKRSTPGGAITNLAGQTGSTYTPDGSVLGVGTWFIVCTVTPECGSQMTSNEVTVIVLANLSNVAIAPTGTQNITDSETGTMLTCTPTGGGTPSYQWGKRSTSGGSITTLTGETSATYTPDGSVLGVGTWFIVCTVSPMCGSPMVSNEVTVNVSGSGGGNKIVFVTSSTHRGNLGGWSGACAECAARASTAGLTGTFQAILSDGSTNAKDRLNLYNEAYYNTNGDKIADNIADFWDGNIDASIRYDENGVARMDKVWTGSDRYGVKLTTCGCGVSSPGTCNCSNWTTSNNCPDPYVCYCGNVGHSNYNDYRWLEFPAGDTGKYCGDLYRIYCIQVQP
jgi:hypothetical protein